MTLAEPRAYTIPDDCTVTRDEERYGVWVESRDGEYGLRSFVPDSDLMSNPDAVAIAATHLSEAVRARQNPQNAS